MCLFRLIMHQNFLVAKLCLNALGSCPISVGKLREMGEAKEGSRMKGHREDGRKGREGNEGNLIYYAVVTCE